MRLRQQNKMNGMMEKVQGLWIKEGKMGVGFGKVELLPMRNIMCISSLNPMQNWKQKHKISRFCRLINHLKFGAQCTSPWLDLYLTLQSYLPYLHLQQYPSYTAGWLLLRYLCLFWFSSLEKYYFSLMCLAKSYSFANTLPCPSFWGFMNCSFFGNAYYTGHFYLTSTFDYSLFLLQLWKFWLQ